MDRGYRNGYGKRRGLTLSSETIRVRRPRVPNTEERFESRVLPLFALYVDGIRVQTALEGVAA